MDGVCIRTVHACMRARVRAKTSFFLDSKFLLSTLTPPSRSPASPGGCVLRARPVSASLAAFRGEGGGRRWREGGNSRKEGTGDGDGEAKEGYL